MEEEEEEKGFEDPERLETGEPLDYVRRMFQNLVKISTVTGMLHFFIKLLNLEGLDRSFP